MTSTMFNTKELDDACDVMCEWSHGRYTEFGELSCWHSTRVAKIVERMCGERHATLTAIFHESFLRGFAAKDDLAFFFGDKVVGDVEKFTVWRKASDKTLQPVPKGQSTVHVVAIADVLDGITTVTQRDTGRREHESRRLAKLSRELFFLCEQNPM